MTLEFTRRETNLGYVYDAYIGAVMVGYVYPHCLLSRYVAAIFNQTSMSADDYRGLADFIDRMNAVE